MKAKTVCVPVELESDPAPSYRRGRQAPGQACRTCATGLRGTRLAPAKTKRQGVTGKRSETKGEGSDVGHRRRVVMSLPQRLLEGYAAFRSGRLPAEQSRYRDLAERGQSPEIMVIGCCDSRVSPEVIFDARPGAVSYTHLTLPTNREV